MKKLLIIFALFCTVDCTAQSIDATLKKYIDSIVTVQLNTRPGLTDTLKITPGQATISTVKNADGSNTGTIDLTLLWNEINALKTKIAQGFTVNGIAK